MDHRLRFPTDAIEGYHLKLQNKIMRRKIVYAILIFTTGIFLLVISFLITEYKATEIPENECRQIQGIVTRIAEGGVKDATFTLAGTPNIFYINRGLENKFLLEDLQREAVGKHVTILYSDHTNILSGVAPGRHIRKLIIENKSFYSEF